ncbi:secretory protein [Pontibacter sp. SGAir0037]|nr:secretory protein [Pontibacter sp. SGAir0037]
MILALGVITHGQAQDRKQSRENRWTYIGDYISKDSVTRGPYTLVFINKDSLFHQNGADIKKKMIDAFFTVYPQEAKRFNPNTARKVTFVIDPGYQGVAAASSGIIRYSPKWMLEHPGDIDVVTHEAFHIVQAYKGGAGPGWLTEGITDYVRYKYGVDNAGANWSLPELKPEHSYTNSYRITGRFLAWLEKNINAKIVDNLDSAMRSGTYTPETWVKLTGKTVDELWQVYAQNPAL